MATIREVAERAQVSPATVSHVINHTRFVSEETIERVVTAMHDLGYQPNALARSLRSGKTHTIGLVLPDSANPFFAEIGHKIEASAYEKGYNVILCNTEGRQDKESFYLNVLYNKRVDGIILVSVGVPGRSLKTLNEKKVPLVVVDRDFDNGSFDMVQSNNYQGGLTATRHLINLGHSRIACILGPSEINPSSARADGYQQALMEAGIPLDPELVRMGDFHPESGWKAATQLLNLSDRPSAIFACNDLMAMGVLRAASEYGIAVPQQLALVGYDDIELAAYTTPPLTTIAQPKHDMARIAINNLVEKISNNVGEYKRSVLEPVLVVRKSCGAQQ